MNLDTFLGTFDGIRRTWVPRQIRERSSPCAVCIACNPVPVPRSGYSEHALDHMHSRGPYSNAMTQCRAAGKQGFSAAS